MSDSGVQGGVDKSVWFCAATGLLLIGNGMNVRSLPENCSNG
jgi:hypothetical protein